MLKKILLILGAVVLLLVAGLGVAYLATGPEALPQAAPSYPYLAAGPYEVASHDVVWEDETRPTDANGDFPGAATRTLGATLSFPVGATGSLPLVVYSHGFMSNRGGGAHYAALLASHGYVVVAADYPLTNGAAPGGPNVLDVVNQPGDVSFLIDQAFALEGADKPFDGTLDATRIGVMGISLGGLTSTLAGYHPRWRDARIAAVASIAGPAYMFDRSFYTHGEAPFLMIAGTLDAIVPYAGNADIVPQRAQQGTLVRIDRGSHLGFVAMAEPAMRGMEHPDGLGCGAILSAVPADLQPGDDPFAVLGAPEDGVVLPAEPPALCAMNPLPEALHPGRQHMITKTALLSFFEAQFASGADRRAEARTVLHEHLGRDFDEASVEL